MQRQLARCWFCCAVPGGVDAQVFPFGGAGEGATGGLGEGDGVTGGLGEGEGATGGVPEGFILMSAQLLQCRHIYKRKG